MNIVCVICSELLVPSNEVFHTPCGHIFHHICLIQWLERSKTCPQCRERTTESKIHRIYFNFSNNDSIVEDPSALQSRIDNLTLQLQLRDQRINNLTEIKEKLDMQTAGLRKEVRKVESEINGKNSAIHALKEQIKFYNRECQDIDTYKKEIEQLKKKNEDLKNLQILLDASVDEVDDIMAMTCDIDKLKTYIVIMKKNMNTDLQKKRELRDKVKTLQQELMRVSATSKSLSEERIKRRALEEQLIICESEKINLQNQLLVVQENSCKFASNINIPAEKQDSLKVQACDIKSVEINENATMLDVTPRLKKDDSCIIIDSDSEITPKNIKSQDFFSMKNYGMKRERSNSNLKVPSILAKKSKFHASNQKTNGGMTFDGFGGHAKYDKFPNPNQQPPPEICCNRKRLSAKGLIASRFHPLSRTHSRNVHRPFALRSPHIADRFEPVRAHLSPSASRLPRSDRQERLDYRCVEKSRNKDCLFAFMNLNNELHASCKVDG